MKKFISMAMTLSLITVMLTSCGGKGTSKPKKEKETTTTTAAVVVQDDTTTTTSNTNYEPLTKPLTESSSVTQTTYRTTSSTRYSTKYTQNTTQKATTKKKTAPSTASTAYQVSTDLVPHVIGNVTKAWKLNRGGANITISRIEYGDRVTQYFSRDINKNIVNPKSVSYQPACSVAVIEVNSATKLNVSKGNPSNLSTTEALAKGVNAVIAINSQTNYEENKGAVIRGGSIYKNFTGAEKDARERLVMHKDGTWTFVKLNNEKAKYEVEKGGAYNSIRYQKVMIRDGKVVTSGNDSVHRSYAYLGRISNKKYVMMVTEFMPALDAAEVLKAYGCTDAVRVQGGNCTQMYVRGIGNTTGSNGASIKGLNKVGMLETEWFAKNGLLASGKGGGPCYQELEVIYF